MESRGEMEMGWVSCHEAVSEAEAEIVVALLEHHGIPSRVQPMRASPFPSAVVGTTSGFPNSAFGVHVLVSEDDLARARTVIDGAEWPELAESDAPEADVPVTVEAPRLPILDTVREGLRLVVARPFIFVAALPNLTWAAIATVMGLPGFGFFATETCPTGSALVVAMPGEIFFGVLGQGIAIAIAAGAARGTSSWADELALVGRKVPALIVVGALPLVLWPLRPLMPGIALIVMPAVVYVAIRLIFYPVAMLVHDGGIREGLERSWAVTHAAWWRTFGLLVLLGLVGMPISWAPPPFWMALKCAIAPIFDATLVVAYLRLAQLAGASPTPAPSADPAGSAPPRALPSPPPLRP